MRDRPMSAGDDREARRRASRCARAIATSAGEGRADRAGAGTRGGLAAAAGAGSPRSSARERPQSAARVRTRGLGLAFCRKAGVRFGSVRLLRAPPGDGGASVTARGSRDAATARAPPPPPRAPPPPPSRTGSRNPTRATLTRTRGDAGKRVSYAANRSRSRRGTERFGSHSRSFRRDARFFPSRPSRPPRRGERRALRARPRRAAEREGTLRRPYPDPPQPRRAIGLGLAGFRHRGRSRRHVYRRVLRAFPYLLRTRLDARRLLRALGVGEGSETARRGPRFRSRRRVSA